MRIVIPVEDTNGTDAKLSGHFDRDRELWEG
jgi:predicted Fe-Mo cluster-binding NifX family protein